MNKAISTRAVGVIVALSLLWAGLLALNVVPQLRGDFGWRWPYTVPHDLSRVWPFVFTLAVYLWGAWLLIQRPHPSGLLGWAIMGAIALTLAGLYVAYDPFYQLYSVTVGLAAGGWHYAAGHIIDLSETLRRWPAYMVEAVQP